VWVLEGVLGVADLALEVADLALEVADLSLDVFNLALEVADLALEVAIVAILEPLDKHVVCRKCSNLNVFPDSGFCGRHRIPRGFWPTCLSL
jgi:hypothetical protein